jgi:mannose-6-phosphate isomerase-like protein (cupin superfamily)
MKLNQIDKIKLLIPHFGKAEKNLYTWKELESLINLRPFVSRNRFDFCRTDDWVDYRWNNTIWTTEPNAWPVSCLKDVLNKTSVYIADCSRANKKINSVCKMLEELLDRNTDCHIYFSVDKSLPNFGKHKDISHNFIVVVDGSIQCEVWTDDGVIKQQLNSGDYVFIPAHVFHRIQPLTEKRLSLSFAIATHLPTHYEEREWLKLDKLTKV